MVAQQDQQDIFGLVSKGMVFPLCRAEKEGGQDNTVQEGQGDLKRTVRLPIWVNPS